MKFYGKMEGDKFLKCILRFIIIEKLICYFFTQFNLFPSKLLTFQLMFDHQMNFPTSLHSFPHNYTSINFSVADCWPKSPLKKYFCGEKSLNVSRFFCNNDCMTMWYSSIVPFRVNRKDVRRRRKKQHS